MIDHGFFPSNFPDEVSFGETLGKDTSGASRPRDN